MLCCVSCRIGLMEATSTGRRVGVYGWGVVAPGAPNVAALGKLLRRGGSALSVSSRPELGQGLFVVGNPDFTFEDYAPWVAERHGDTYLARMCSKMGENVLFAVGATIQALRCSDKIEPLIRQLDDECHVYIGSGVGRFPANLRCRRFAGQGHQSLEPFLGAAGALFGATRRFGYGGASDGVAAPVNPATLPVDSEERFAAVATWEDVLGRPVGGAAELHRTVRRHREDDRRGPGPGEGPSQRHPAALESSPPTGGGGRLPATTVDVR